MVNTYGDKNITQSNKTMIYREKNITDGVLEKEPSGSLGKNFFRPLGLNDLTDYPTMLTTFNSLISRIRV